MSKKDEIKDEIAEEEMIYGANDSFRDKSMIKICEFCGRKYHPRRNSYQALSRFCSQLCVKKSRRGRKKKSPSI